MRNRPKTIGWKWTSLALVMALLAGACTSTGTSETSEATDGDAEGGGEAIEIEVWASDPWMMPPDKFAGFMEEHPNITVITNLTPESDQLQQMQARQDVGQPLPDLVMNDNFMLEAHANAGHVRPIDDMKERWQEEDPESFDAIFDSAWEENVVDGETLGLSLIANMEGLYYNVPWFEEAGIDPNDLQSLDGVLDAMRALKETRPDGIPLALTALPGEGVTSQKAFMVAAGSEFDGAVPNLSSEGALYVIDWFMQAISEELIPVDAISWEDGQVQGTFFGGNGGIIVDGIHAAGDFALEPDFDYGEEWGFALIPPSRTGTEQDGNHANAPWTWFISTGAEAPYETSLVLRYINDHLVEMALNGSGSFRNIDALSDPRIPEAWPYWNETMTSWPEDGTGMNEAYLVSTPTPAGLNGGEVETILERLFSEIIVGTDLTPEELAEKYQPELDET